MLLGTLKLTRCCNSPASLSKQEVADALLLGNQAACASTAAAVPATAHGAVQQRRGSDQRLLLRSVQCDKHLKGPLLTSLANTCAGTLTSLQVKFLHAYEEGYEEISGADMAACTRAMAAFVHLRELGLSFTLDDHEHDQKLINGVMSAVQHITQLTVLHVDQAVSAAHARSVPKSHVQLELSGGIVSAWDADDPGSSYEPANLRHLTGLISLTYRYLQANDVLPAAVRVVHLMEPCSTLPLVQGCGQNLRKLRMRSGDCGIIEPPVAELRRLQQLPQLQVLRFSYIARDLSTVDGLPACLPALPLQHLHIAGYGFESPVGKISMGFLSKLGSFSCLARLELLQEVVWAPATIEVLSGQLQKLPVLSVLTLKGCDYNTKVDVERSQPLLQAVVGLSSLTSLSISYWPLAAAASQLAAAMQLTKLEHNACLIGSAIEAELAAGLSHLLPKRLNNSDGGWPTDVDQSDSGEGLSGSDGVWGEGRESADHFDSNYWYDSEFDDTSSDSSEC